MLISLRVIGELGANGLEISSIAQVLLIVLLLGAGTDYGLFLVFRVREEIREGHSGHDAVVRALVRVGESITASVGTVILALLTLLLASFGLYHDLGPSDRDGGDARARVDAAPRAAGDLRPRRVLAVEDQAGTATRRAVGPHRRPPRAPAGAHAPTHPSQMGRDATPHHAGAHARRTVDLSEARS